MVVETGQTHEADGFVVCAVKEEQREPKMCFEGVLARVIAHWFAQYRLRTLAGVIGLLDNMPTAVSEDPTVAGAERQLVRAARRVIAAWGERGPGDAKPDEEEESDAELDDDDPEGDVQAGERPAEPACRRPGNGDAVGVASGGTVRARAAIPVPSGASPDAGVSTSTPASARQGTPRA